MVKTEVKMKFNQSTVDAVSDICKITGTQNKAQIVATAIKIYHELWVDQLANKKIYSESKDGKRKSLVLL